MAAAVVMADNVAGMVQAGDGDGPEAVVDAAPVADEASALIPLTEPADGVPDVVDSADALERAAAALAAGHGPVAVDAERASGYRYGQRAYLLQFRRPGAGTFLIDPIACTDLSAVDAAIGDVEWILHAASQDLPCLREVGLVPRAGLFDTELAARLLGRDRVGLGPLAEHVLGLRLAKEHSAVNWSKRPLPHSWLRYAALDVEVLDDLRDHLEQELRAAGKLELAQQEFAHVIAASARTEPAGDRWRRTSGLHRVRGRRPLAVVRALWDARDAVARRRDLHPGRVLSDAAICEAATADARTVEQLRALGSWKDRTAQRDAPMWARTIATAHALPESDLPLPNPPTDAPPPPRLWPERDPAAASRLAHARAAVSALAQERSMPQENLVTPDYVRRICWAPPEHVSVDSVAQRLATLGARPWQCEVVSGPLAQALARAAAGVPAPAVPGNGNRGVRADATADADAAADTGASPEPGDSGDSAVARD